MNEDKLLRMSAWLLVFSGILIVLGQLLAHTAIGQVTPFEHFGAWVAVLGGSIALAAALTMIIAGAGKAAVGGRQPTKATMNATAPSAQPQPVRRAAAPRNLNYADLQW